MTMDHTAITDQIYTRHVRGLRRATGDGTWLEEPVVRMALWLALTEQAERLSAEPAPNISKLGELERLRAWLDDNIDPAQESHTNPVERALDAIRTLQDAWAAEVSANSSLQSGLTTAQNEVAMLRQQRADLQACLETKDIDLTNERARADALQEQLENLTEVALQNQRELREARAGGQPLTTAPLAAGANEHNGISRTPTPTTNWTDLSTEANEYREGLERGAHSWRKLPLVIRLELVQAVLRQHDNPKQDDFDVIRPAWMPQASGLPRQFGVTWTELPTVTF